MTTIHWTRSEDGNQYSATNKNGFGIGQVRIKLATRCEWPVLAVSVNGRTREFATVQSAKDWVEDLYSVVAETIENE